MLFYEKLLLNWWSLRIRETWWFLMGPLRAVYWILPEANRSDTFIWSLVYSRHSMNRRYFHWHLWFILSLLFSPGIHQPCVTFNGHISFSRTSSLLSKCKFPASHSLTAKMCFSCPRSSISCLVEAPGAYEAIFYCCPYIRKLFLAKRLLHTLHALPVGQLVTYFLLIQLHICEHLHGQCCRENTVGYGIRETWIWKLTSLRFLCHKMEIIRISQAQYGDEANSQKSSAMTHPW